MRYMFNGSRFNGDISKWDVSRVKNMASMFNDSKFNGDISAWNVSNVEDIFLCSTILGSTVIFLSGM